MFEPQEAIVIQQQTPLQSSCDSDSSSSSSSISSSTAAASTSANAATNVKNDIGSVVRYCEFCYSTNTPTWRRGPTGKGSLCNACGIKWRLKKKIKRAEDGRIIQPVESSSPPRQPSPSRKRKEAEQASTNSTTTSTAVVVALDDYQSSSSTAASSTSSTTLEKPSRASQQRDRLSDDTLGDITKRGKRYYCKYCDTTFSQTHFRNSQQFGAHCSNCSRRTSGSSSPLFASSSSSEDGGRKRSRRRVTSDPVEALEYGWFYQEDVSSDERASGSTGEEEFYDCEALEENEYVPTRRNSAPVIRKSSDVGFSRSNSTTPEIVSVRSSGASPLDPAKLQCNSQPSISPSTSSAVAAVAVAAAAAVEGGSSTTSGLLARLLNAVEHQLVEESELAEIRDELQEMRSVLLLREQQLQKEILQLKTETKEELALIRSQVLTDLDEREKLYRKEFDQLSQKFMNDISNKEDEARGLLSAADAKIAASVVNRGTEIIIQSVSYLDGASECSSSVSDTDMVESSLAATGLPSMEHKLLHQIEVMQTAMKVQYEDSKAQIEALQEVLQGVASQC